jgi:hypothetical protein
MVKIVKAWNEDIYLMLTGGYLSNMEDIRAAAPRYPKFFRLQRLDFGSREEATAWTLSALCRQISHFRRRECGGGNAALKMPLETWILGAPTSDAGKLKSWFATEGSDYRIILHQSHCRVDRRPIPVYWGCAYHSHPKLLQRPRHLPAEQRHEGLVFLEEILKAYRRHEKATRQFLQESGHPYWFSEGFLTQIS